MRLGIILLLLVTIIVGAAGHIAVRRRNVENGAYLSAVFDEGTPEAIIKEYADSHHIAYSEYPEEIAKMFARNEEIKDEIRNIWAIRNP